MKVSQHGAQDRPEVVLHSNAFADNDLTGGGVGKRSIFLFFSILRGSAIVLNSGNETKWRRREEIERNLLLQGYLC